MQQRTVLYRHEQSAADLQHGSCRTACTRRCLGCRESAVASKALHLMLLGSRDVFLGPFFLFFQHWIIYKKNRVFLDLFCFVLAHSSGSLSSIALASIWLLLRVCGTKWESREATAYVQQSGCIAKVGGEETLSSSRLLAPKVISLVSWDMALLYLWQLFSHHQWAPPLNTTTMRT